MLAENQRKRKKINEQKLEKNMKRKYSNTRTHIHTQQTHKANYNYPKEYRAIGRWKVTVVSIQMRMALVRRNCISHIHIRMWWKWPNWTYIRVMDVCACFQRLFHWMHTHPFIRIDTMYTQVIARRQQWKKGKLRLIIINVKFIKYF